MEEKAFLDKANKPADKSLKEALGPAFAYYEKAIKSTEGFEQDWNFTKSGGWMLKVHDKKKALFYVIPLKNQFKISMAIRESEREAFMDDQELFSFHNAIKSAKKYAEGYALQLKIGDESEYLQDEVFLNKLIAIRLSK
ncbi:MAG: DUF3788 family protein [Acidobacteriota bacterium]